MKILTPLSSLREAEPLIAAGADEIYCGVLPPRWRKSYTNVASPNRREWSVSNLQDYDQLAGVVELAHRHSVPVYLTMNALYTQPQFRLLRDQLALAARSGVDALIVADLGLLLLLRRDWPGVFEVHISTGGTTFNSQAANFYRRLGAKRIVLPRSVTLREINSIREQADGLELELFILNRGCKNIDGFCTFQHGVNEIINKGSWTVPKAWHADYYFLEFMKRLPLQLARAISRRRVIDGRSDGACFLNYRVTLMPAPESEIAPERRKRIEKKMTDNFDALSGWDPCGLCRYEDLARAGIGSLKIIGRSNPLSKKIADVEFIAKVRRVYDRGERGPEFQRVVRQIYRKHYGYGCHNLCYYP